VLFSLHESPRFLVANGRSNEAVVVLRNIAAYNDLPLDIDHQDVQPQSTGPADSGFSIDEERALIASGAPMSPLTPRSPRRPDRRHQGPFAWWYSWIKQMRKLFSPKWRRTVIFMWIIWGALAFGELTSHKPHRGDSTDNRRVHDVQCVASQGAREPQGYW
jgi:hypothetical protein